VGGETSRRAIAAIAIGAVAIDSALLGLVAPLLPEIQSRTGAGDEAVGFALAAYAVPIALFSLPLGRAADALGRRKLLVGGLALVAVGSVLVAVTDSVGALMASRGVQGLGSAASWIAALALVSDYAPEGRRGQALGAALAATGIGSIVGPALGGVTADLLSFEAPFLIACGFAIALLVAALIVLPRELPQPRSATPALRTILRACRSGPGAWAAAMVVVTSFVLGLIEVVAPLDLDARLGLSSSVIGLLFAASIAVDAVFAPLGGRWGDRRGRAYPAFAGLLGTALAAVLLAVLPGVAGTVVALAVYGAGFSLAIASAVPWLDEAFDASERGLAYGVQNLLYAGGYAIGPVVGGTLLAHSGADAAYALTSIVVAATAVGLWFAWPTEVKSA
jgi:DHA1 family multidrug resistance protein-like MFS transporter